MVMIGMKYKKIEKEWYIVFIGGMIMIDVILNNLIRKKEKGESWEGGFNEEEDNRSKKYSKEFRKCDWDKRSLDKCGGGEGKLNDGW